jgi:hypothetical protein
MQGMQQHKQAAEPVRMQAYLSLILTFHHR